MGKKKGKKSKLPGELLRKLSCKTTACGTSLAAQRLRLHASNAGGAGLVPGQGTTIL